MIIFLFIEARRSFYDGYNSPKSRMCLRLEGEVLMASVLPNQENITTVGLNGGGGEYRKKSLSLRKT